MQIQERVAAVRAVIGRDVTLLAATKTRTVEEVRAVYAAGADAVGENRAQELAEKQAQRAYDGMPLHFIGALQSNKAKLLVGRVELIQSVDSERLCQTIGRLAEAQGVTQRILLEVNIGKEPGKAGVLPGETLALCGKMARMPGVLLCGLMAIPPAEGDPTPHFAAMRRLFEAARPDMGADFSVLSMGMSGDFAKAVAEGSTLVRIGTALFGARK